MESAPNRLVECRPVGAGHLIEQVVIAQGGEVDLDHVAAGAEDVALDHGDSHPTSRAYWRVRGDGGRPSTQSANASAYASWDDSAA